MHVNFLSVQSVLKKVTAEDAPSISDTIMQSLLQMLHSSASANPSAATPGSGGGVQEDAMLAISALIEKLGAKFSAYMEVFKPLLIQTLKNTAEYQVALSVCVMFSTSVCSVQFAQLCCVDINTCQLKLVYLAQRSIINGQGCIKSMNYFVTSVKHSISKTRNAFVTSHSVNFTQFKCSLFKCLKHQHSVSIRNNHHFQILLNVIVSSIALV